MIGIAGFVRWVVSVSILSLVVAAPAAGATLTPGFSEALVASGLQRPTAMAFAPDGRLFVCEQTGTLRVIKDGVLQTTPFVTLTVNASGERGLLGVAFDPNFHINKFVYVYYTATTPTIHNRVSRFTASGDVALPGETIILDLETLGATNHNGGAIHFGKDGKLYVAVGDNAVSSNAQTLANRLGKILRINADGTIPDDNPFAQTATGVNRAIWARGLRNPFTFGVEPITGRIFLNDVGENTWEEVNEGVAGANYGWPTTEGPTTNPAFRSPVYAYTHDSGCAIAGGEFHGPAGAQFPLKYWGAYFFADLCGGWIRVRHSDGGVVEFATGISQPVDLKIGRDGALYYLARGTGVTTGVVFRISYTLAAPRIHLTANGSNGPVNLTAGSALNIAFSFNAGPSGTMNPAEVYFGVLTPTGVFWRDPDSGAFVSTRAPIYTGSLPTHTGSLLSIPSTSVLGPGLYWWFVIVDNDTNGVPNGLVADGVLTVVP